MKDGPLPLLSLFCGAGGLDLGFRRARFTVALACDNFGPAIDSYNLNSKRKVGRQIDLATVSADRLIELMDEASPNVRPAGIIGGPPCQGFSRGNAFADAKDVRNRLPLKYALLIGELNDRFQLKFFVFENVPGLLNARHARRFNAIKKEFGNAGFNIFQQELDAVSYGVPQHRRRLFIVGLNRVLFPDVTFAFPKETDSRPTVRDAIGGLPEPAYNERNVVRKRIPHHVNHWTSSRHSPKLLDGDAEDGRSFRRLDWTEPSPTVAYGNREIHVHPDGGRRLSIHEAMLLQGFPSRYQLSGLFSHQVTQVSNAVPPPVAQALARSIKATIRSPSKP